MFEKHGPRGSLRAPTRLDTTELGAILTQSVSSARTRDEPECAVQGWDDDLVRSCRHETRGRVRRESKIIRRAHES